MPNEPSHTVSAIEDPLLSELVAEGDNDDELSVIARLRDTQNLPSGVRIVTQFGDIATLRVRRTQLNELAECNSVMAVEASRRLSESQTQTHLRKDVVYSESFANTQMTDQQQKLATESYTRRPVGLAATGRGCVVAVLDWGCDFAHPAFKDQRGKTRLLAIWDQRGSDDDGPANRWGYGQIHDAERINSALEHRQPYAALDYDPADSDSRSSRTDGWTGAHGTHVLDIAAGTRRSNSGGGVAPDAELIFVHLARTTNPLGTGNLGDSASVLEALDFVFRTAGERPCVVNMSVGAHGGPHDGTTLVEHGIDNAVRFELGRCVVNSGGNYYNKSAHAQGRLMQGAETALTFDVPPRDPTDSELEVWYPGVDRIAAVLIDPDGNEIAISPHGSRVILRQNNLVVGRIHHISRSNGDNSIDVFLKREASAGRWNLLLRGSSIGNGHYHAWIERDSGKQPIFVGNDVVGESTTGTICNGQFSITVGAYDPRDQNLEIGRFSSSGPTRDGRTKPELIAPGVAISAARSTPRGRTPRDRRISKSGTSMAAPHVAGTIAVMFEAAGTHLSILDTRRLLFNSLDREALTTKRTAMQQPHRFGYGVLAPVEAERVVRSWVARHADNRNDQDEVNEQTSAIHSFEIDRLAEIPIFDGSLPENSDQREVSQGIAQHMNADHRLTDECGKDESKEFGEHSLADNAPGYADASGIDYESHDNHFTAIESCLGGQSRDQMLDEGDDQDFIDVSSEYLNVNDNESDGPFLQIGGSEIETEIPTENYNEGASLEPFRNALLGSLVNELVQNVSALHRTAFDAMGVDENTELEAVANPTELLQHPARPGDVLQRALAGEFVYSGVIVSDEPENAESLAGRGIPVERVYGGAYVEVVEISPSSGRVQSIGRRLTDANGRLPYGQTLLRANVQTGKQESSNHAERLPFSPPDPWCLLRQRIVSVAQAELLRWRRANGTTPITEGVPSQLSILREYWRSVPGLNGNSASLRMARLSATNADLGPWSAAFISFVMKTAGVVPANGFKFGAKHISYIVGALRNREHSDRSRPFWLLDSQEMQVQQPQPGDLVCLNRRYRDRNTRRWRWTTHSYSSLRRQFWPVTQRNRVPWGHSHCSLIVGRGTENGQPVVYTIGGNEGNSVMRSAVALNQRGGILNPAQHNIFGLIKLTMCPQNRNVPDFVPAVRGRLQRLNLDAERIQILVDHLQEREGNYSHFYCDHNGFVTIGIGHLVDRRGEPDNVGQGLARALSAEVNFTNQRTGRHATVAAVVADWQRVKGLYRDRIRRGRRPGGATTYSGIARLRITEAEGQQLSEKKYTIYINRLYRRRPALLRVDNYITMAMVDVLYNAAGIPLFGNRHRIPDLWAALDSNDPAFNLDEALRLFQLIWRNRGRARYRQRHQIRVNWFRLGIAAMRAP